MTNNNEKTTTERAIELAETAAEINAGHATTLAITASEAARDDQPWTAQNNLREARKYQAIAEAFATAAGTQKAELQAAGSADLVKAAAKATAEAENRWLKREQTKAIHDLIAEATK